MGRSNKCGGKATKKNVRKSKKCSKRRDIKFASSMKAKRFINAKLEGQSIECVGGINGVLGPRLQKSGCCNAQDLACKLQGFTKRNYLRYIMKVGPLITILIYHCQLGDTYIIKICCFTNRAWTKQALTCGYMYFS